MEQKEIEAKMKIINLTKNPKFNITCWIVVVVSDFKMLLRDKQTIKQWNWLTCKQCTLNQHKANYFDNTKNVFHYSKGQHRITLHLRVNRSIKF